MDELIVLFRLWVILRGLSTAQKDKLAYNAVNVTVLQKYGNIM